MKMPRTFSSGIGKWSPSAILLLLAAGTFIVASDGPDAQQKFVVGAASRFVMFDEMSTSGELDGAPSAELEVPQPMEAGGFAGSTFHLEAPASYLKASASEPMSPVVQPALAPTLLPLTEDGEQSTEVARFTAGDQDSEIGLLATSPEVAATAGSRVASYDELTPVYREASQPIVREAYDSLDPHRLESRPTAEAPSRTFFFSGDDDVMAANSNAEPHDTSSSNESEASNASEGEARFSVTIPEEEIAQLPAATTDRVPAAKSVYEVPEAFATEDATAYQTVASMPVARQSTPVQPQASTDGPASPSDQLTRLPNPDSPPEPMSAAQGEASGARVSVESDHVELPPVPAPIAAERGMALDQEMAFVDQYEAPYFEEPALSADCGMACPRTWYAKAELLYIDRRSQEGVTLTDDDFIGLNQLSYDTGARVTMGTARDCLDGYEITYTGGFDWTERSTILGDNLNPTFAAPDLDISAFRNAQEHSQEYRADFHSAELNRKWWGWDVISTSVGIRYIYIGERYKFFSRDLIELQTGTLELDTDNNLLGGQIGVDLYRPLGRWTTGLWAKGGVYANFFEGNISLVNAGVSQYANGDDDSAQFAFEAEIGTVIKYQLTPRMTIQAGYELWYVDGVATALNQSIASQNRNTGNNIDSEDDIFYHGASLGVEMVW